MSNIIILTQTCTNGAETAVTLLASLNFNYHSLFFSTIVFTCIMSVMCHVDLNCVCWVRLEQVKNRSKRLINGSMFCFFFFSLLLFQSHSLSGPFKLTCITPWVLSSYPDIAHSYMSAHSEFKLHMIHLFTYKEIHIFSVTDFCVNISFTHFPFHPHHPRHKQTSVSIQLTIHSNGCPWQHQ